MAYSLEDEFGDIIGKARRGLGLSVGDVAGKVGVSGGDLEKMESYELTPAQAVIERLAVTLGLQAARLGAIAREEWEPAPSDLSASDRVAIEHFLVEEYNANVYLLVNGETRTALLIDAGGLGEEVAQRVGRSGLSLLAILFTHGHGDHTEAANVIQEQTGAALHLHAADVPLVKGALGDGIEPIQGNETLEFDGFAVRVVPTPGHTAGSVTYVVGNAAFTGDTLFAGSMGRCSLDYPSMLQAIQERIFALPPATSLFPGHGPATTVAEELAHNPFFD